jgi:hypothetical protein
MCEHVCNAACHHSDAVVPWLVVGDVHAAAVAARGGDAGCTGLISMCRGAPLCPPAPALAPAPAPVGVVHGSGGPRVQLLLTGLLDSYEQSLVGVLDQGVEFVRGWLARPPRADPTADSGREHLLVHCAHGRSRSAGMAAGVLMAFHRLPFATALRLIRATRRVVDINDGFATQLLLASLLMDGGGAGSSLPAAVAANPVVAHLDDHGVWPWGGGHPAAALRMLQGACARAATGRRCCGFEPVVPYAVAAAAGTSSSSGGGGDGGAEGWGWGMPTPVITPMPTPALSGRHLLGSATPTARSVALADCDADDDAGDEDGDSVAAGTTDTPTSRGPATPSRWSGSAAGGGGGGGDDAGSRVSQSSFGSGQGVGAWPRGRGGSGTSSSGVSVADGGTPTPAPAPWRLRGGFVCARMNDALNALPLAAVPPAAAVTAAALPPSTAAPLHVACMLSRPSAACESCRPVVRAVNTPAHAYCCNGCGAVLFSSVNVVRACQHAAGANPRGASSVAPRTVPTDVSACGTLFLEPMGWMAAGHASHLMAAAGAVPLPPGTALRVQAGGPSSRLSGAPHSTSAEVALDLTGVRDDGDEDDEAAASRGECDSPLAASLGIAAMEERKADGGHTALPTSPAAVVLSPDGSAGVKPPLAKVAVAQRGKGARVAVYAEPATADACCAMATEGRLHCPSPGCGARLGHFSWIGGKHACPCSAVKAACTGGDAASVRPLQPGVIPLFAVNAAAVRARPLAPPSTTDAPATSAPTLTTA